MSGADLLLNHVMKLVCLAILMGLFARRRAHLCWSFVAYLVTAVVTNSLISFWPDQFYRRGVGQVGPVVRRQSAGRHRQRPVDRIGAAAGADRVAVPRIGRAGDDRLSTAGCA